MDIVVRGRHCEVPDRFRKHVTEKLAKMEKLDGKLISVDVELSEERNPRLADHKQRIEITCRSRGPVIRAEAAAPDPYAALDLAWSKLEGRLRRAADRRRVHHGQKTPVSVAAATAQGATLDLAPGEVFPGAGLPGSDLDGGVDAGANGYTRLAGEDDPYASDVPDGPMVLREKVHETVPMTLDQALYEMELVGHDFYLFVDSDSGQPSVVYRRRAYDYGVIRLVV